MNRRWKIVLLLLTTLLFIGCDRVTKELAKEHLKDRPPLSFFHDTFRLDYVENTGAFLSLGAQWPPAASFWLLNILPLLLMAGILFYAIRKTATESLAAVFPFLLICSGGLGNIIDRLAYQRHVSDFMNMGIAGLRTGIFNFADVYVTTGVILLLAEQWKNYFRQRQAVQ